MAKSSKDKDYSIREPMSAWLPPLSEEERKKRFPTFPPLNIFQLKALKNKNLKERKK